MEDTVIAPVYSPCSFPAGINLAEIEGIRYARNPDDSIKMKNGHPALVITFVGVDNEAKGELMAYTSPSSQWIWDKLCKAAKVDNTNRDPSVRELVGQRLYIHVVAMFKVIDGVLPNDPDFTYIEPKFYMYGSYKPKIANDPQDIGEYKEGDFVIYDNADYE